MAKERIVHISNLAKSFGNKKVIEGVSLTLFAGENLVVLGKSGTGKSVIMKCIVGLLEPDRGSVNVFGQEVTEADEDQMAAIRSRIGYLFQEGALYDSMTILENMLFPAKRNPETRKLPEKELTDLAEMNLENVGLAEAIDKMPAELSGGMKKRAGLARTLMLSPELIIYDEPTTGLDPFTSESISRLIMKVKERYDTSSIIITHDIECASITGDRITVLHEGKLVAEGTIPELKEHPDENVRLFFTKHAMP